MKNTIRRNRRHLVPFAVMAATFVVLLVGVAVSADRGNSAPPTTVLVVASADDFQDAVLEDGVVTDDEMLETIGRVLDCVRAEGFHAELVAFEPRVSVELETGGPSTAEADAAEEARTDCEARLGHVVFEAYWAQYQPLPED